MAAPPLPLRHYAPPRPVTEDTPPDMLEGAVDLAVTLPTGKTVVMNVHRRSVEWTSVSGRDICVPFEQPKRIWGPAPSPSRAIRPLTGFVRASSRSKSHPSIRGPPEAHVRD